MSDKTSYTGFVVALSEKSGKQKNGKSWFKYNFKVEQADGTESPWVSFIFNKKPPFEKDNYIRFQAEKDQNGYDVYVEGSGEILPAPARAADTAAAAAGAPAASQKNDTIGWQNARTAAIATVTMALANNSLPLTQTKSKAGDATRFTQIQEFIDKLTVRFFIDAATLRVLENVADEGVVTQESETPNEEAEGSDETGPDAGPDDADDIDKPVKF